MTRLQLSHAAFTLLRVLEVASLFEVTMDPRYTNCILIFKRIHSEITCPSKFASDIKVKADVARQVPNDPHREESTGVVTASQL